MPASWAPLDVHGEAGFLPAVSPVGGVTAARRVTVTSSALGERVGVTVYVYETAEQMRTAMYRYHGLGVPKDDNTLGCTQASCLASTRRAVSVIVRLARGHLGTQIVSHEIHHASTALYGAHVGDRISTLAHLNHHNEPFAHLFSDLLHKLVDRLYDLGYYPST